MTNACFITDADSRAVCSLVGLPTGYNRMFEFQELARGLREAIRQLDDQKSGYDIATRALFAARLVKASCDGFIATADAIVDSKQTNLVKSAYEHGSEFAGAASKAYNNGGAKGEFIKAGINLAATGIKKKLPLPGVSEDVTDAAVDLGKNQSSMIVDAVNADEESVISGLISATASIGKLAAAGLKHKIGKRIFGVGEALANTVRSFVSSYRSFKEDDSETMFAGAKRSMVHELGIIEKKIASLQSAILDYEKERANAMR